MTAPWIPLSGIVPQATKDGNQANGMVLKFYVAGTLTPLAVATDSTGGTTTTEFVLNTQGLTTLSTVIVAPHVNSVYKEVLYLNKVDADANNTGSAFYVIDNLFIGDDRDNINSDYNTLALALDGDDAVGSFVRTSVRSSALGNGGGIYKVVDVDPLFPDVNPQKTEGSGDWLELVHEGELYLSQAGVGLNSGDESVITNAVMLDTAFTKYIFPKNMRITNPLRFRGKTTVTSEGPGFLGGGANVLCIGTEAYIFDSTTEDAGGITIEGITFEGDDSSNFSDIVGSPTFGDFRFSIFRDNFIHKFLAVVIVGTGTDFVRNDFDNCVSYTISGGDNSILRNFFNTRTKGTSGNDAVTFASNNSTYDGNFITAGTHATQSDNPNGLLLGACNRSRILNTWVDLGGSIGVSVGLLATSTLIHGTQVKMGGVTSGICMNLVNATDTIISNSIFDQADVGVKLSSTCSNVEIGPNIYTLVTDNITQNGSASFDITINEPSFNSYPISKSTGSQTDYLRGINLTNEGATGPETFSLPASGQLIGDTFFFTRVNPNDFIVSGVFALIGTGPQTMKVTWNGGAWFRAFLDTIPPTSTTSLLSGEIWNDAGTLKIVP